MMCSTLRRSLFHYNLYADIVCLLLKGERSCIGDLAASSRKPYLSTLLGDNTILLSSLLTVLAAEVYLAISMT